MSTDKSASLVRAMARTPLFEDAEPAEIARLVERGHVRRFRRGSYLFHEGDASPEVFFLMNGRVEISSDSAGGRRQLHTTIEAPQLFGELGVLADIGRTAAAFALEESTVWVATGDTFVGFLAEAPRASRALLRALARQIQSHEAFVEDLLYLDLKGRVSKRLLQLVSPGLDELPSDGTALPSIVTHADLASLCGGSRENVTRILSDLQRRGLIERNGRRIVLLKIASLAKIAGVET